MTGPNDTSKKFVSTPLRGSKNALEIEPSNFEALYLRLIRVLYKTAFFEMFFSQGLNVL